MRVRSRPRADVRCWFADERSSFDDWDTGFMRRYHDVEYNPRERRHLRDRTSVHRARQASLRVTDSEFGPISIGSRRALARFRRRMVSRRATPGALRSSGAGARKTPRTRSGCGVEGGTVVGARGSGIDRLHGAQGRGRVTFRWAPHRCPWPRSRCCCCRPASRRSRCCRWACSGRPPSRRCPRRGRGREAWTEGYGWS